jgi:putative tryptophan/tyrosine transport system substrate-binding protein
VKPSSSLIGDRVRRRHFLISLLPALLACSIAYAESQQPRVGVLSLADSETDPRWEAFRRGLRELGYIEGRNITFEYRFAHGDFSRLQELTKEVAKLPLDVIMVDGVASGQLAAAVIRKTPIVIGAIGADPVALGLAESLARPGRNVTGFTITAPELAMKRVDLARTAFPAVTAITVLLNPTKAGAEALFGLTEEAARSLGLGVSRVEAVDAEALEALGPEALGSVGVAVVVLTDAMFWEHRKKIIALVKAARVPAVYPEREYTDDGGLMAYGPSVPDNFRRAASYVDRILKGEDAAELPIQEPVKFDLIINLKTAKTLGLTIPQIILARADEVIE